MKNKKIIVGVLLALGIFLGTWLLHVSRFLDSTNQSLSDHLYSERDTSNEIIIVAIDDKSMSEEELGIMSHWSKVYFAQALQNIETARPALIFFDIFFAGAADDSSEDTAFTNVLKKYHNVYLNKQIGGNRKYDELSNSFIFDYEKLAYEAFSSNAKNGFYNFDDSKETLNLSTIYSFPYQMSVNGKVEKHVDFKIAEEYLKHEVEVPTEQGQMLINYAQKPYGFPMVSFSDVYNGRVDPKEFENKIVLIGATSESLQDNFFTPIEQKRRMPGIEIHANAIQTILDEAYLEYQSTAGFLVMVGLIVAVSVFVFLFAPVLVAAGFLVLEMVAFPFYAQWSFDHGTIPDLIWPVFAMGLSYLAVLVYRNLTEFAEKRKLKMAFSRYVSPELAEEITEKPDMLKLGGERKNITALFLDIENFTTLSEGLEPQEVVRVINVYFDALAQVIMGHGGSVDKYEGDAIMALFGAPVPSLDHAVKACYAAMAIQARMKELNVQMGYNLNIRVGLASGDAIVGNMGSSQRFDYTAMGDTVNTASRLEGANKFYKTGILVNPGTFEAAQSQIFFRKIDTVCLKGKENAIGIYQVLGTQEGATPEGKAVVAEWQSALEDYKAANWDDAEKKIRSVLTKMPEDGPAKTFLGRIAELKMLYGKEQTGTPGLRPVWDGVWRFESK